MSQLTVDDRLAIGEVLATYCHCIDLGLWDRFLELFTPDARLDFGAVMGVHEGHAGIEKFTGMLKATGITMRHYTTNVVITGESERAHAESYVLALTGEPGSLSTATGRYQDDLVKSSGRWLLRSRRALLDVPAR